MLMELINNPDLYVIVTFKDLEKFIMFYSAAVFIDLVIAEYLIRLFRKIKCIMKKKLNK